MDEPFQGIEIADDDAVILILDDAVFPELRQHPVHVLACSGRIARKLLVREWHC